MNTGGSFEPLLIRCTGCMQNLCTVSCGSNAVVYIRGDLLLEAHKCSVCERYQAAVGTGTDGIPPCITACHHSKDKVVLEALSGAQKRIKNADLLPLLTL
ncbi:MAG: hypothetical protein LBG24_04530 [Treponema sp.]|jgi:Fe-S-cluster-containing dehydrogenase component|nr:hypothetical protein [Treponema sp.]